MSTTAESTPLPIDTVLSDLLDALGQHTRCLLVAQPGAGKTTRVPLALLSHFPPTTGRWLLLEPRRVAARLAAGYMAQSLGETVGQTVGYRIRGESRVSPTTRLEVLTQGVLTRMLQDDPLLEGIAGIIFDEFHERALDADLGLALCLDVQHGLREDLKLLVMSATLDVEALLGLLGADTPVIDCPGQSWPVITHYRNKPLRERDEDHQAAVVREALAADTGHLLVFLPGQAEIRRLHGRLAERLPANTEICELHGQLPLARQQAVLKPPLDGTRRIILSTAVAESSVTIPGVRIVVDAGWERAPVFKPRSGMSVLETRRLNRASADQRRGRAGREAAGVCYRLWAQEQVLAAHREPEILQSDLSVLAFELIRWGVHDANQLQWVTPPPAAAFAAGLALLNSLGLTQNGGFSASGRRCARWPTHPRFAVLLEKAIDMKAQPLACWLVAWLEDTMQEVEVDLETLLSASLGRASSTSRVRPQWQQMAKQWSQRLHCSLEVTALTALATLLAVAYPDRIAQNLGQTNERNQARFRLVSGAQALLDATQALSRQEFLVAVELDGASAGARIYHAVALSRSLLESLFPVTRTWQEQVSWDESAGRLIGEEQRALGAVVLERRSLGRLSPEVMRRGLLQGLRQRGSFQWQATDQQLLGRLRLLHRQLGSPWPDVNDAALLATADDWLAPRLDGLSRLSQVDSLPLTRILVESFDWSLQHALDSLAPTHMPVPSGSRIMIDYSGEEPILAVKLQELFGQTQTPTVLGGRLPLLLHLLSPARRPVQVTRDLAGFWSGSYFEVRKELKGRYPRLFRNIDIDSKSNNMETLTEKSKGHKTNIVKNRRKKNAKFD